MDEEKRIMGLLARLYWARRLQMERRTARFGVYFGQVPLLQYIIANPGCSQKKLADELRVSPASVALSTKRMQRAGMVRKEPDESDLRNNRLFITELGLTQMARGQEECERIDQQTFRGFTPEERRTLEDYLSRMLANMGFEQRMDSRELLRMVHERDCSERRDGPCE